MNTALRYLQEALKKNEHLLSEEHIQTTACCHALAITFNCMGAFKLSLQDIGKMNTTLHYLQEALKKNERLLGKEHIQTVECYPTLAIAFSCMGAFKLSLHANPELIQAFQAAATEGSGNALD
ncbi:hypothetical protein IFM89_023219 [Coptis chinensis]|uniref:Kinesin light chain n=1 Tax=Coptis chinensis TaxID=261450 RepID=A0A835M1A9_9MAGN|nr:hypothetical protein IFM89_023219 [Coptis chinensis]